MNSFNLLFDKPTYSLYRYNPDNPLILVCEHASCYIPAQLQQLGLEDKAAKEHIAWDIGALDLAKGLSDKLNATLLVANYSRLLIDLNRPLEAPDSIPDVSEIYTIIGNQNLSKEHIEARQVNIFEPFHQKLAELIAESKQRHDKTRLVGVHSYTATYKGQARALQAGVLYMQARHYGEQILAGLAKDPTLIIAANEPYQCAYGEDTTVPLHGDDNHIPAVLLEIRNNEINELAKIDRWVNLLSPVL